MYNKKNWKEEIISAKEYLNLNAEQKKKIVKATPYVKPFGSVDMHDTNLAGMRIIWKVPVYKFKL